MKKSFNKIVNEVCGKTTNYSDEKGVCPDCFVAKIEINIGCCGGYVKYLINSICDKNNRNSTDANLKKEEIPTIAVVLESPHIEEFKDVKTPMINPNTSKMFSKYFNVNIMNYIKMSNCDGSVFYSGTQEIKNGIYKIKIINAVQYQCSIGENLSNKKNQTIKNEIVKKCLEEEKFKNDLIQRLDGASIIVNCCTGQKNNVIDGMQKTVQDIIDSSGINALKLYGYHPSSPWFLSGFKKV